MKQLKVDFFVLGVARGGTTSLYNYMQQHPAIFLPKVKECNFFSEVNSLDKEVYLDPDPGKEYHMKIIKDAAIYKNLFEDATPDQIKGEVSPSYLWDRNTAKRIHDHNPNAKLLISLRNPIERAFSHYQMHYQTGHEKEDSFEAAIKAPKNAIWGGGNMYLEMSLYYEQLTPYFELFDRKNIMVLVSEEWTARNGEALNEIYDFLGLEPFYDYETDVPFNAARELKNKGLLAFLRLDKVKRPIKWLLPESAKDKLKDRLFYKEGEKQCINPETYRSLEDYFREDVYKTGELTGIDLHRIWEFEKSNEVSQ